MFSFVNKLTHVTLPTCDFGSVAKENSDQNGLINHTEGADRAPLVPCRQLSSNLTTLLRLNSNRGSATKYRSFECKSKEFKFFVEDNWLGLHTSNKLFSAKPARKLMGTGKSCTASGAETYANSRQWDRKRAATMRVMSELWLSCGKSMNFKFTVNNIIASICCDCIHASWNVMVSVVIKLDSNLHAMNWLIYSSEILRWTISSAEFLQ